MRWGNYYLATDARISLREGNVVLWENTLNSSPRFLPWGSQIQEGGSRVLICVPGQVGEGGSSLDLPSPGMLSEEVAQSRDVRK